MLLLLPFLLLLLIVFRIIIPPPPLQALSASAKDEALKEKRKMENRISNRCYLLQNHTADLSLSSNVPSKSENASFG